MFSFWLQQFLQLGTPKEIPISFPHEGRTNFYNSSKRLTKYKGYSKLDTIEVASESEAYVYQCNFIGMSSSVIYYSNNEENSTKVLIETCSFENITISNDYPCVYFRNEGGIVQNKVCATHLQTNDEIYSNISVTQRNTNKNYIFGSSFIQSTSDNSRILYQFEGDIQQKNNNISSIYSSLGPCPYTQNRNCDTKIAGRNQNRNFDATNKLLWIFSLFFSSAYITIAYVVEITSLIKSFIWLNVYFDYSQVWIKTKYLSI